MNYHLRDPIDNVVVVSELLNFKLLTKIYNFGSDFESNFFLNAKCKFGRGIS